MNRIDILPDPDRIFAHTRMSFGDHLEELRARLIRAIGGVVVGLLVSFLFGDALVQFITHPVEVRLLEFYNRRVEKVAKRLRDGDPVLAALNNFKEVPIQVNLGAFLELLRQRGFQIPRQAVEPIEEKWADVPFRIKPLEWQIALQEAQRLVGRPPLLSTMNVLEAFLVYIKVCLVSGFILSSPWVFWQLWAFVATGLYPHEKRSIQLYLPVSLGLFLTGVFMCQFLVIPKALHSLLWFNEWLGLEPDLRLSEWLTFALLLPLVFGISFQTPVVMLFLAKIGVCDTDSLRQKRRIAWFALAAFAAFITPIDAISMLLLWIPMCGLYELGILLVQYTTNQPEDTDLGLQPVEEMVEV